MERDPGIVTDRSRGLKGVRRVTTGVYCVLPEEDLSSSTATVTVDLDTSTTDGAGVELAQLRSLASGCEKLEIEVVTRELRDGRVEPSDAVAFALLVP